MSENSENSGRNHEERDRREGNSSGDGETPEKRETPPEEQDIREDEGDPRGPDEREDSRHLKLWKSWNSWRGENWLLLEEVERFRADLEDYEDRAKELKQPNIKHLEREIRSTERSLNSAEQSLRIRGDVPSFYMSYFEALRKEVRIKKFFPEFSHKRNGSNWFTKEAKKILANAASLEPEKREEIRSILSDDRKIKKVDPDRLILAMRNLHGEVVEEMIQDRKARKRRNFFVISALVSAGLLAVLFFPDYLPFVRNTALARTPLVDGPMATPTGGGDVGQIDRITQEELLNDRFFYIPVVVFGLLGASMSGLQQATKLEGKFENAQIPVEATISRIVTGGVAALFVFLTIRSGFINIGSILNFRSALVIAFVSGFSERVFLGTLERVTDRFSIDAPKTTETQRE